MVVVKVSPSSPYLRCLVAFDKLDLLNAQLERLPASLPNPPAQQSCYQWHLNQDFLSNEGIVTGTNEMLEQAMGMRTSRLTICKQGEGISSVVEVLRVAPQQEPSNAIISKWINDITEAGRCLCPGKNALSAV